MFLQRYDIINKFITARNYKSFLEIGTDKGATFSRINVPTKVAVDPDNSTPATNHVTSDAFFASTQDTFDIIFIDGLHEHNQVMRDIHNSLAHLAPNGVIVLHDCNPSTEAEQCYSTVSLNDRVWLGTVWKAYVAARATLPYEMCVLVPNNGDSSCGIIDTNRPKVSDTSALPTDMDAMTWNDFRNHPEWMNFRPYYDFAIQENHNPKPRIAFMFGTRGWYHRMALSLKSLLKHTYLDRIYFMIEDDFFPEPLPPFVQCVNVSKQQFFPEDGPNYKSIYSYMVLLRPALPLMFPDIDLALCIDADTLTRGDIGAVWDTDMSNNYLAAVKEFRQLHGCDYYNCGFMLMNFANMRRDNIPEQSIKILNEQTFRWKEQDVLNDFCRCHIHTLPSTYNHAPGITGNYGDPCFVRHYIGNSNVKNQMLIDAKPYEHMSWTEIKQER